MNADVWQSMQSDVSLRTMHGFFEGACGIWYKNIKRSIMMRIDMSHGSGGKASADLMKKIFKALFKRYT